MSAMNHAMAFVPLEFANTPILAGFEVTRTRGKTANGNAKLRMTWLRMSKSFTADSPPANGRQQFTYRR